MPKLIVFEGIDGCGKTTTLDHIEQILKNGGFKVYRSYEPSNPYGKMAKFGDHGVTPEEALNLWWLARRMEQRKFMDMDIDVVLKDRYYDSTFVYQGLEGTSAEEHNFDEEFFMKPHHTIFLDVDPEVSLQRMGSGRPEDLYETSKISVLEKRRQAFQDIIESHKGWRSFSIIDTTNMTIDEVIGMCSNHILRHIDNHADFCLGGSDV